MYSSWLFSGKVLGTDEAFRGCSTVSDETDVTGVCWVEDMLMKVVMLIDSGVARM